MSTASLAPTDHRSWRSRHTTAAFFFLACLTLVTSAHAQLPSLIDLGVGGADVTVTGVANGDHSGFSLVAGDVNGDGHEDLIVLSYWAKPLGGARIGEIDIIWGATFPSQGNLPLSQESAGVARVFGAMTQAWDSVISGGDFNGDGCFDIIWGQPFGPDPDFTGSGITYVIFGSRTFPDTLDIGADPSQVITVLGTPWTYGELGQGSCGCDLNGDGFDDIVVAAPVLERAEIYVVWGGTSFSSVYDTSQPLLGVTRMIDSVPYTEAGWNLGCADFDEDGFEDLVMSSSGDIGIVTVLFGRSQFPDSIQFPDPNYRMKRIFDSGPLGSSITTGDFNGDGVVDLGLANGVADPLGCYDCGAAYVLMDVAALPDSSWLDEIAPVRVFGSGTNTSYGSNLEMADITGDGRDELIVVGKGNYNSPTSIDQTLIIYGTTTPEDTVYLATDTTTTRIRGPYHNVDLGRGLASADFNGDTIADLALGAHRFQGNAGRTYVFFGRNTLSDTDSRVSPNLALRQNYPNPFNPTTTIAYTLHARSSVHLAIYNVEGRNVATLVNGVQAPGEHRLRWDGRDDGGSEVASGVYFCRLSANRSVVSMKLVLVR